MNEVHQPRVHIEGTELVDDPELDNSALELRACAFLFYVLGLSVAIIIFCRSAWYVANA